MKLELAFLLYLISSVSSEKIPTTKATIKDEQTISKISNSEYQDMLKKTYTFLDQNKEDLTFEKNDSGFVRLNLPSDISTNPEISKLRVNYWPSDQEEAANPERLHSHPKAFESYILHGGYTHEICTEDETGTDVQNKYQITKFSKKDMKFDFIKTVKLECNHTETKVKNDKNFVDELIIHRIISSQPKTLTFNAVLKGAQDSETTSYNVYRSLEDGAANVNTQRNMETPEKSRLLALEIMQYLDPIVHPADNATHTRSESLYELDLKNFEIIDVIIPIIETSIITGSLVR